jgi:RNA polymerase sigma factor (sigma-70 family)
MDEDTKIGGLQRNFPVTRRSAIIATRSDDQGVRAQAFETLISMYWKPAYKYVRIKWRESNENAKDLIQGFFARAIEKGYFQNYDPARASFRTYLRTCLDGYVANEKKAAGRQKRSAPTLDFDEAERELEQAGAADGLSMEDYFHHEWVRNIFGLAVEALRNELERKGKTIHFRLFERYDLSDSPPGEELTYDRLAAEYGIAVTDVTNYLALARREFRRVLLGKLREATGGEQEFKTEARLLLGDGGHGLGF